MWFKNLTMFQLDSGEQLPNPAFFAKVMEDRRCPECGPLEAFSVGFVSPFGPKHDGLIHSVAGYDLIALGQEKRVLPQSVIDDAVAEKAEAIEVESGRPPGKRRRRELAEAAMMELLPKAFIQRSTTLAYLDRGNRLLIVDTTSDKTAEMVATELREALGSFPAVPLMADGDPSVLLTGWLSGAEPPPEDFELGEECELRDPGDQHTRIIARGQDLTAEEILEHLKSGKQVHKLGLIYADRIAFVLSADLKLAKIKFLDLIQEKLGHIEGGAEAELDARFALMTHEVARLIGRLAELFEFLEDAAYDREWAAA